MASLEAPSPQEKASELSIGNSGISSGYETKNKAEAEAAPQGMVSQQPRPDEDEDEDRYRDTPIIRANYNYKPTNFDLESRDNRVLRLHGILVDMGYSPEFTEDILKDIGDAAIDEVVDHAIDISEEKGGIKEGGGALSEEEGKKAREQFMKMLEKVTGETDVKIESFRKALPEIQKHLSKPAMEKQGPLVISIEGQGEIVKEEVAKPKDGATIGEGDNKILCGICLERLPPTRFFKTTCQHDFCEECMTKYLRIRVETGAVEDLYCPFEGCRREIEDTEIKRYLDHQELEKYEIYKRNGDIALFETKRWCITPNCPGVIQDPGRRKAICPVCKDAICWDCGENFHRRTCERAAQDSKSMAYANYKSLRQKKPCPKCKEVLEKHTRSNHIRCHKCQHEFCWICSMKMTKNHYAPFNVLGCALMHEGDYPCFGDDNCFCIPCDCITCDCPCCECRFNLVGFSKRLFARILCVSLIIPCCPCLSLIAMEEECCDD
uniref:RBR-type E3 ubiquitin transferase n=1 Tax=Lotharella globosa TaxID=91324 RepID=A0A6U3C7H7_9EUKA|mmetsp:Transcript_16793/g.33953  ORF Transcript_16793/g.33953 Transcript_16793/m.33953 type:complete len:493 (+) Transcript_16793:108-1586(+)